MPSLFLHFSFSHSSILFSFLLLVLFIIILSSPHHLSLLIIFLFSSSSLLIIFLFSSSPSRVHPPRSPSPPRGVPADTLRIERPAALRPAPHHTPSILDFERWALTGFLSSHLISSHLISFIHSLTHSLTHSLSLTFILVFADCLVMFVYSRPLFTLFAQIHPHNSFHHVQSTPNNRPFPPRSSTANTICVRHRRASRRQHSTRTSSYALCTR